MTAKSRESRTDKARRRARGGVLRAVGWTLRTALVLSLLGGGGYAFCRYLKESEHYRVRSIRVEGAVVLDPNDILLQSGVTQATNLLFLRPDQVEARVRELPYVKDCAVSRIFPDLVVVSVTERVAEAVLVVHNHVYEIDADGVVLREIPLGAEYPGALITDVPGLGAIEPGQTLTQPALHEALRVWEAFRETALVNELTVSEIAALDVNDIRMYCNELVFELRWGRGGYHNQARRLEILWQELGGALNCNQYLDLRFGRDLACR